MIWEDDFRFQLTKQPETKISQAQCQTMFITAYTFYPTESSRINNPLTIVDTPGFGDTRGIKQDYALIAQIKIFFSLSPPHGVDHIDAIGFVVKSASSRLTATQRYIINSIYSIFGKDMEQNIFLMVTFCDHAKPPVLEAIRSSCTNCITF